MAVHDESPASPLETYLDMKYISRRLKIWLWLRLYEHTEGRMDAAGCGGQKMEREILRTLQNPLRRLRVPPQTIKCWMDRQILPDERLAWITEDKRQLHWLRRAPILYSLPCGTAHLTEREELIAVLDIWDTKLTDKADWNAQYHAGWLAHTARDADFVWFMDKREETARCQCAWEWLEKKYLSPRHRQQPTNSYRELLMFFDDENLPRAEQQNIVKKIKQRWSREQLNVRNPDSKQVNIMLPADTIAQLDKLAKQHDLSRAKLIARLIAKESQDGQYLGN